MFDHKPFIIAGPCSAESYDQLHEVVEKLVSLKVNTIRAGVWKPRSSPYTFEGKGEEALRWIADIKKKFSVRFAIEVATPQHIELAHRYGIDIMWLGARTTVNPFHVQELAEALRGISVPIMIKNPINPDLGLWIGAIERMQKVGVKEIWAIHRGFSSFEKSKFRNIPLWQIPLELKTKMPSIPLFGDPSHIGGKKELIEELSQKALDLDYDGLMIETHPHPEQALSDKDQQITPEELGRLLSNLKIKYASSSNPVFINQLEELRKRIDQLDREILEALALRMAVVKEIGKYKKENQVAVFQIERWNEIFSSRSVWGDKMHLDEEFIQRLYSIIHEESIRLQTDLMNDKKINK